MYAFGMALKVYDATALQKWNKSWGLEFVKIRHYGYLSLKMRILPKILSFRSKFRSIMADFDKFIPKLFYFPGAFSACYTYKKNSGSKSKSF